MKAPVVLFVYNREDKARACLAALEQNDLVEQSDLYIFSDGYKSKQDEKQVNDVRSFLIEYKKKSKFKNVYIKENETNNGLAKSVINGVSYVIDRYGKVIVVEDDLITAKDFLQYMNDGLDFYESNLRYGSISAFTFPLQCLKNYKEDIYVLRKGDCWGWGTWKDRWKTVDWDVSNYEKLMSNYRFRREFNKLQYDFTRLLSKWKRGKSNSWAIRWCLHLFLNEQLTVYPRISRTQNIGLDGSGTNCGRGTIQRNEMNNIYGCNFKYLNVDKMIERKVSNYEKTKIHDVIQMVLNNFRKRLE